MSNQINKKFDLIEGGGVSEVFWRDEQNRFDIVYSMELRYRPCGVKEMKYLYNERYDGQNWKMTFSPNKSNLHYMCGFIGGFLYSNHVNINGYVDKRNLLPDVESIVIPSSPFKDSSMVIDSYAFEDHLKLKKIAVADSNEIRHNAFDGCLNLRKATFNVITDDFDKGPLYFRSGLNGKPFPPYYIEKYGVSDTLTVGDYAFRSCRSLQSCIINNAVSIGVNAFEDCTNLTSLTIGNKLEYIGADAFKNCRSLKELRIPATVLNIGYNIFKGCSPDLKVLVHKDASPYIKDKLKEELDKR